MAHHLTDVERRLIQLIDSHFNRQRILVELTTQLRSGLRMDSLDLVELVMDVEHEFQIDVPVEDFERADRVGELADLIERKRLAYKS